MNEKLIIIAIIIAILCLNKQDNIIIPKESIRFRIIANSNSKEDQELKKRIVKSLSKELINKDIKSINEERSFLKKQLPVFENIVKNSGADTYSINYGKN